MILSVRRMTVGFLVLSAFASGAVVNAKVPVGNDMVVGTVSSMVNVFPDTPPSVSQLGKSINIDAARRERQSAQIVVISRGTPARIDRVSVSDLTGHYCTIGRANVQFRLVGFTQVVESTWRSVKKLGYWPDPLLKMRSFECPAGQARSIWINVRIPETAGTGDYSGRICLFSGSKKIAVVPIKLHVYDFELPRLPLLDTSYWTAINDRYDLSKEPHVLDEMIRLFGEYRTSTNIWYNDPVKWYREKNGDIVCAASAMKRLITKADAADIRTLQVGSGCWSINNFTYPRIVDRSTGKDVGAEYTSKYAGDPLAKLYLKQMCDWLATKGWLNRAYMQIHDESFDPEASHNNGASWASIRDAYQRYEKLEPRMRFLGLTGIHPDMQDLYDIWAPMIPYYDASSYEMVRNGISLRGQKNFCAHVTASSCGGGPTLYWTRPIDAYDGCNYSKWLPEKSPAEGKPEWLRFDFDKPEQINGVRIAMFVAPRYTGSMFDLKMEGSTDGIEFSSLETKTRPVSESGNTRFYDFPSDKYKAIRLVWSKAESRFTPNNDQPVESPTWQNSPVGVREVEFLQTGRPMEESSPRKKLKPAIMWEYQVGADYPGVCIDADPSEIRQTGWICWQHGVEGYLNYGGAQWSETVFPPGIARPKNEDPIFWPPTSANGSSLITYPGKNEVLPSIRFARFRDGLQDYDYLKMLDQLDPNNALLKKIRTSNRDCYARAAQISSTRRALAKELELICSKKLRKVGGEREQR